jgi:hypothetical protein
LRLEGLRALVVALRVFVIRNADVVRGSRMQISGKGSRELRDLIIINDKIADVLFPAEVKTKQTKGEVLQVFNFKVI